MNMNNSNRRTVRAGILCLLLPVNIFASQPADQIAAEISRTKQVAVALKIPEETAKQYQSELNNAEQYLRSGYRLLGLYQLQLIQLSLMADEFRLSKSDLQKKGMDAFEQDWRRMGVELTARERRVAYRQSPRLPAAVKAMIESALTQIRPYYTSGRLYALNTTINDGLIYLGRSWASAEFALFGQQLRFTETPPPLRLRSLAPEIARLEAEVVRSYSQPGATAEQLSYIRANVTLKMAQELDREKRYYGALHQYLAAARLFATITLPEKTPSLDELKAESEKLRVRLDSGNVDHSIGLLYWQIAQSSIDRAAEGINAEENIKRAAVIFSSVLPCYFDYINGVKR